MIKARFADNSAPAVGTPIVLPAAGVQAKRYYDKSGCAYEYIHIYMFIYLYGIVFSLAQGLTR